eukprot:TRINITY_DN5176_c0_g2_i1.p1 TRINITY_DN5176_c0_g2~~TRINITY_DN5176_c0_g2_i1.p1  ORF type:complete len:222 (-),score=51.50 TRINITY_DN5176_c0_g2_i1:71-736(-)
MCIRDRYQRRVHGGAPPGPQHQMNFNPQGQKFPQQSEGNHGMYQGPSATMGNANQQGQGQQFYQSWDNQYPQQGMGDGYYNQEQGQGGQAQFGGYQGGYGANGGQFNGNGGFRQRGFNNWNGNQNSSWQGNENSDGFQQNRRPFNGRGGGRPWNGRGGFNGGGFGGGRGGFGGGNGQGRHGGFERGGGGFGGAPNQSSSLLAKIQSEGQGGMNCEDITEDY